MSVPELIASERENLLPTAPVSSLVQWYERGEQAVPYAAIVVAIEAPGRVGLTIFKPNAPPMYRSGVRYISDQIHADKANPTTDRCGSWGYGDKVPRAHLEYHLKELDKRELNFLKDHEAHEQAAKAKAEKATAPKKPILEPV